MLHRNPFVLIPLLTLTAAAAWAVPIDVPPPAGFPQFRMSDTAREASYNEWYWRHYNPYATVDPPGGPDKSVMVLDPGGQGITTTRDWMTQSFVSVGAGGLLLVLMLASSGYSLFNYFYVPAYAKSPDWRALATTLRQQSAPGDLVIHNYRDPALQYYLQDDLHLVVLPASSPVDPVATA